MNQIEQITFEQIKNLTYGKCNYEPRLRLNR